MKIKTALFLSLLALAPCHGAYLTVSNLVDGLTDTLYANSDNSLSNGGIVTIGYFDPSFDPVANSGDVGALIANFTVVDSAITGSYDPTLGGYYDGYAESGLFPSTGIVTSGDPLYLEDVYSFIGNGSTLATSTEFALVKVARFNDDMPIENTYTSNPQYGTILIGSLDIISGDLAGQGVGEFDTLKMEPMEIDPED
jgi:hypothetical protein